MTRFARGLGLAAALAVSCAMLPDGGSAASPLGYEGLTPPEILARYAAALAKLKTPKAMVFDYTVSQLGLRNMEQTHHVYRSALDERDETLVADGYTLRQPEVRIIANRGYRYDLHAVAPTPRTYAFAYVRPVIDGDDVTYVFRTKPLAPGGFGVSEIEVDGATFLPKVLRFRIQNAGASGSGQLTYARADAYYVIATAQVDAHLANGSVAHETIKWSDYQFPPSLPTSTFVAPQVQLAPATEPAVLPSTTPVPAEPGAP